MKDSREIPLLTLSHSDNKYKVAPVIEIKADKTWQKRSQIKQNLEIYSCNMKSVYNYLGRQVAAEIKIYFHNTP